MRPTRYPLMSLLAAVVLAGCGEDEADGPVRSRTTPNATSTPAPVTTPSPTATPTATPPPEENEGGAGDEGGLEQGAGYAIARDGGIFPPEIEVAAFLPVRLSLANEGTRPVRVDLSSLGQGAVDIPAAGSRELELAGPRPGRYEIRAGSEVAVLVSLPGGSP